MLDAPDKQSFSDDTLDYMFGCNKPLPMCSVLWLSFFVVHIIFGVPFCLLMCMVGFYGVMMAYVVCVTGSLILFFIPIYLYTIMRYVVFRVTKYKYPITWLIRWYLVGHHILFFLFVCGIYLCFSS